ncbi:hypothetical protein [Natroniella acetigena]|nr:hypothetical protein [Natroniella acetigena]
MIEIREVYKCQDCTLVAAFNLLKEDVVAVRGFCNLHGLWV